MLQYLHLEVTNDEEWKACYTYWNTERGSNKVNLTFQSTTYMKHLHQLIGIVHLFRMRRNEMSLSLFAPMTGLRGKILKLPCPIHTRRTRSNLPLWISIAEKLGSTLHSTCYRALYQLLNKILGLHLMRLILFMGNILFESTWARPFLVVTSISNYSLLINTHHLQIHPTRLVLISK